MGSDSLAYKTIMSFSSNFEWWRTVIILVWNGILKWDKENYNNYSDCELEIEQVKNMDKN